MIESASMNLENIVRQPIRPLGKISDFVVEALPYSLAAVHEGRMGIETLSSSIQQQLQDIDPGAIGSFVMGRDREVALLDLLILQSAIGNSGGEVPQKLTDIIEHLAEREGRIPALTYEDVILINPLDTDPRTFTKGAVGKAELRFYTTHKNIEDAGVVLNELVENALRDLGKGNSEEAKFLLEQTALPSSVMLQEMFDLRTLDPKDFAAFRIYFGGYPEGNKGPSGAFSPAIATLDVFLSGFDLPKDRHGYLRDNRQYFPRDGQRDIDRAYALVNKTGALDKYREMDRVIDTYTGALHQFLTTFRSAHHGRVGEQIPEALKGTLAGTGGETDVAKFLRERIQFNKIRRRI